MMIDTAGENNSKRMRLHERFQRIEKARPAFPPIAVNLTRQLTQLIKGGQSTPKNNANQRLEKRALQTGRNPRKF